MRLVGFDSRKNGGRWSYVTTVKSTVVGTNNYERTGQSQLDPTIVPLSDVPAAAQDKRK
jgi:hypothetical protein